MSPVARGWLLILVLATGAAGLLAWAALGGPPAPPPEVRDELFRLVEQDTFEMEEWQRIEEIAKAYPALLQARDARDRTPLLAALATRKDPAGGGGDLVTTILIRAGSDVNARDFSCHTPLYYAITQHTGMMSYCMVMDLLEANADPNIPGDKEGTPPLHLTVLHGKADLLLKHGARRRAVDLEGNTALHRAAAWGAGVEEARLWGNHPEDRNRRGETPLEYARRTWRDHPIDPKARREVEAALEGGSRPARPLEATPWPGG